MGACGTPRCILDEAQSIRNARTQAARSVLEIRAERRHAHYKSHYCSESVNRQHHVGAAGSKAKAALSLKGLRLWILILWSGPTFIIWHLAISWKTSNVTF